MTSGQGQGLILLVKYASTEVSARVRLQPAKPGDCGLDLYNASPSPITVLPGRSVEVPAGVSVKIPDGYAGFIRPRSSTFARRGLFIVEGIIDSGYTGPLFTHVWNPALNGHNYPVIIGPWERLSQLIVVPVPALSVVETAEMPVTVRGATGFGSTGT